MSQEQSGLEFNWKRPQTFFAVALSATTAPHQFFLELPPVGGLLAPVLFLLLANLVPALTAAAKLAGQGWEAALWDLGTNLALSLVRGLAYAGILFLLTRHLFKANFSLAQSVAVVCYSSGLWALYFIPDLLSNMGGPLLKLFMVGWVLYIVNVGLRTLAGLGTGKAALAMVLAVLVLSLVSAGIYKALGREFLPPPPPEAATSSSAPASAPPPADKPWYSWK
ncbi:MAG: hypothetical protein C0405_11845 [Desulfovibrio sp.]|nr:hypothetical protein [Desulfovibrio sp.]